MTREDPDQTSETDDEDREIPESIDYPIDGTLDLHTFRPSEVEELVPAYIEECLGRQILQVRIIHGKGTGTLRQIVHSLLEADPHVVRYWQEEGSGGGWGATVAELARKRRIR